MTDPVLNTLLNRRELIEQSLATIDVWLLIFGIFVVIGVGGESIFGIRAWLINRKLHSVQIEIESFHQAETAVLVNQAADANRDASFARKDAEAFKLDIAKANERAANAEKSAAEANLALEKLKTPRTLSLEQQTRVSAAVHGFPKTPFDIFASVDPEAADLANKIEGALLLAGWEEVDIGGTVNMSRGPGKKPFGILIGTGMSVEFAQSRQDFFTPADRLITALKAQGLAVKGLATAEGNAPNAIHIKIGKKE